VLIHQYTSYTLVIRMMGDVCLIDKLKVKITNMLPHVYSWIYKIIYN